MVELSEYERKALLEVEEYKRQQVSRSPRQLVPQTVSEQGKRASRQIKRLPGVQLATEKTLLAYTKAASGLAKGSEKVSRATLSEGRVVRAFNRKGFDIGSLEDVAQLDLQDIERKVKVKRLDIVYSSLVAVEGAAAGAVISGGELLASAGTVLGAGAGSAPGVGTVAAAMATDAAVVLGASSRAVAHIGMYYGFDPLSPAEAVYGLSIVNLGSAVTATGKVAAYAELSQLTQLLARRASWAQLNEHLLPRLAQQFAVRFGGRLTQRKLGQLVPIAGIGIGAGMNYKLLDDVMDAAYWSYRERFLINKLGGDATPYTPAAPAGPASDTGETEVPIDVLGMLNDLAAADGHPEEQPPSDQKALG